MVVTAKAARSIFVDMNKRNQKKSYAIHNHSQYTWLIT